MMIRTYMSGIAEIDVRTSSLGHLPDLWVLRLQPLLYQPCITLHGSMKWLLRCNSKLSQQTAHRIRGQTKTEFFLDQLSHHLSRPKGELEFQLERVLLSYGIVKPFQLLIVQLRRTSRQRLCLQCAPPASAIICQPLVNGSACDPQGSGNILRTLAILYTPHRAYPQCFQGCVVQLAGIVHSHDRRESWPILQVKKNMNLLMD